MRIKVTVVPRAQKTEVVELADNHLKVKVSAAPVKGKANKQLIEILAAYYGVRKSAVTITSGQHAREKSVEILR